MSVERTITRLLGVDGANELDAPLPNVLVDHVRDHGELARGVAYWLGNAMLADPRRTPQSLAEAVDSGRGRPRRSCRAPPTTRSAMRVMRECEQRVAQMSADMPSAASCASASASTRRRCATC